jgi:hypothetical protein
VRDSRTGIRLPLLALVGIPLLLVAAMLDGLVGVLAVLLLLVVLGLVGSAVRR